jgi:hypothetical protein
MRNDLKRRNDRGQRSQKAWQRPGPAKPLLGYLVFGTAIDSPEEAPVPPEVFAMDILDCHALAGMRCLAGLAFLSHD